MRNVPLYVLIFGILFILCFVQYLELKKQIDESGAAGPQGIQGIQGLQGVQGATGIQGLQGIPGERGSAGQSFAIVASYNNLTDFNNADKTSYELEGNAILVLSDGSLYIWTGTTWIDAGDIKGNDGAVGPQGPAGSQGGIGPTGLQGIQGIQGPKGDTGDTAVALQYASFYDLGTQTGTTNSIQAVKCNYTLFNKGVTIVNGSGGQTNATKITILVAGRYNLQFSLQLHQTNSSGVINIWLRKNNIDVEYSNTRLSIAANNPYLVAAWNFFVDAAINDYYELVWSSTSPHTEILFLTEAINHPAVPSAIITMHQVGL